MSHVSVPTVSARFQKGVPLELKAPNASSTMLSSMMCAGSSATPRRQSSIRDLHSSRPATRSSLLAVGRLKPAVAIGGSFRVASVRRWDGNCRTTTVWDSLRRDEELWFADGDCLINFYEFGQSKRGASLRVSLADIEASNCRSFLDFHPPFPQLEISSSTTSSRLPDGKRVDTHSFDAKYEIYVPAPSHLNREDAFRYHLTTRNFFAWMFDLPIVGERLGEALIATLERMLIYRPDEKDSLEEFIQYLDSQGYADFRECPDHSLAILQLAERYEVKDLWTDAFVHCAGMNDTLIVSGEFELTSRASKALITRAFLEMNMRFEKAGKSLGAFLDEDLSGSYLGLGLAAQTHLDRFRSWLISFYVGKFGYWPPAPANGSSSPLPNSIYRSMYFEFRKLYEYLVDPLSSNSIQDNRPADGGLCVLQNIKAFDKRHRYASLLHPLPLVPDIPRSMDRQKSSGFFRVFGGRQAKNDRRVTAVAALSAATNRGNIAVMECALVREYLYFEKTWTMKEPETIACAEARKVRWILIYAVLQTLICVTRAPREVRDTNGVSYPLCCQVAGLPPWEIGSDATIEGELDILTEEPEQGVQIKPDLDYSLPEQSLLSLRTAPPRIQSLARHGSIGQELNSDSPISPDDCSCNILLKEYCKMHRACFDSDSSTPSSAAGRAGSEGWSSSSSDDGMEHRSVDERSNNDEESGERRIIGGKDDPLELAIKAPTGSFRPIICNSDMDRYIWA